MFDDSQGRPRTLGSMSLGGWLLVALVAVALAGCAPAKTPADLAMDELNAGLAAHTAGNVDEAVTRYRACLKQDSQNQYCIYNLGVIAQAKGSLAEAENGYRLAILIDPAFPSALFNLATIRANAGSTAEAIDLYRRVIQLKPQDVGSHLNLGLLLRAQGDVAAGEAELATAKSLDPKVQIPPYTAPATPAPQVTAAPGGTAAPTSGASKAPSPSPSASKK